MHYIGRLAGRQGWSFENTYTNGEPFRFTLGKDRVLAGLEEGIEGMREGGRRRLIIPSKIGYVDKQIGPIPKSFSNRQRLYATGEPLPLIVVHAVYTTYNV
jgi:FKBP-type peptidyl-prolyl cis-trans isomerase